MTTDIQVTKGGTRDYFDFDWSNDGDFITDKGLQTALFMSALCEARAGEDQVTEAFLRRGWLGNEQDGDPEYEQGSLTWLFEQERITGSTLAELGAVVQNSLTWLIGDGIATSVTVSQPTLRSGKVVADIIITLPNGGEVSNTYELWQNTAGLNIG